MGADAYWYFVDYQQDIDAALQELRNREFEAGRYFPAMEEFLDFPIGPNSPAPGRQHDSIEDALEASEENGTSSILDIFGIADEMDFNVAAPLSLQRLKSLYGTAQPTRQMIEQNMDFFEDLDRGRCIYIVAYKDGTPDEIFFAGYSFD